MQPGRLVYVLVLLAVALAAVTAIRVPAAGATGMKDSIAHAGAVALPMEGVAGVTTRSGPAAEGTLSAPHGLTDAGSANGVVLSSFTAQSQESGILLRWGTVLENEIQSFFLMRSESLFGERTQVSAEPIWSESLGGPTQYEYLDTTAVPDGEYYYWLFAVNNQGFSLFLARLWTGRIELFLPIVTRHK